MKSSTATSATRIALVSAAALAMLGPLCDSADAARMPLYRTRTVLAAEKHRHEAPPAPAPKGPLQIIVSIADQQVSVYSGDALLARSEVSTGVPGHPTPMGVFTVIQKQRWHRSNLYSDAPMPYMQRITWSGVALHAGVLPGHPASHGCIRLHEEFAVRLWRLTKLGARVMIVRNDVAPIEISAPQMFAQKPKAGTSASAGSPAELLQRAQAAAPTSDPLTNPVKVVGMMTEPPVPQAAGTGEHPGNAAPLPDPQPKPPAPKVEPISVFISRKQAKLFVRQGFDPLLESAVTIRDPDRPLGTHVFTAIERKGDAGAMRWTVVSFPDEVEKKRERTDGEVTKARRGERETKRAKVPVPPPRPRGERATAALDRIEIPQDAAGRIAELLSPKSSLIISDYAMSEETDTDTDFIVLLP